MTWHRSETHQRRTRALIDEHIPPGEQSGLDQARLSRGIHRTHKVRQLRLRVQAKVAAHLVKLASILVPPTAPHCKPPEQPAKRSLIDGRRGRRRRRRCLAHARPVGGRRADVAARDDESGSLEGGQQRAVVLPPRALRAIERTTTEHQRSGAAPSPHLRSGRSRRSRPAFGLGGGARRQTRIRRDECRRLGRQRSRCRGRRRRRARGPRRGFSARRTRGTPCAARSDRAPRQ